MGPTEMEKDEAKEKIKKKLKKTFQGRGETDNELVLKRDRERDGGRLSFVRESPAPCSSFYPQKSVIG